ncbi:MAG: GlxA family transcriptional regulator [Granulosicoccus sp.]
MDINKKLLRPFRVGFVLLDGFALMSYASALEPLRAANLLAGKKLYDIKNIPVKGARSRSSSGAIIGANAFMGEQADFDLILVVAGGNLEHSHDPRLAAWLRLFAEREVMIGGVSGGPLILARAGVMDGRRMTIHWEHAQALAKVSTRVVVERSLYVMDRLRLTCAGGAAPLDMMHALITEHHGHEFARKISDWFLHTDIRPADGPQRSGIAQKYNVSSESVIKAIEAMENHIADPLTLSQIADLLGLSARQMNRLFRQHLNTSTVSFYRQMRLRKAAELLSGTGFNIQEIALATGFANGAHLSQRFSALFAQSPKQYRFERTTDGQA